MNNTCRIRLLSRTGRTIIAGLLVCFLLLSVSGPIVVFGRPCGAANSASIPARESESEGNENDAIELEALARATGVRRTSRRIIDARQSPSRFETKMRDTASSGLLPMRVRQMSMACEHDRRNGFGAPLRC